MASRLKVSRTQKGSVTVVALAGEIDETFQAAHVTDGLKGAVLIDLDGVRRITSFGVREWTRAMRAASLEYLGFISVRPSMVTQFNMISDFGSGGELISLFAPFVCGDCGEETDLLIDARKQHTELMRGEIPSVACAKCKGAAEFDELPETYFMYVTASPKPNPPPNVRAVLDGGAEEAAPAQAFRIEKEVSDTVTAFWMYGPLDKGRSLKRLADGLQGDVVVVFGGVSAIELDGLAGLRAFAANRQVDLQYARVPGALAPALIGACEGARVVSVLLPFGCRACQTAELREIKAEGLRSWFGARTFEEKCTRCGGGLMVDMPAPHVDALRALPLVKENDAVRAYLAQRPRGPTQSRSLSNRTRGGSLLERGGRPRDNSTPGSETFGDYRIIERLGMGGMGEVLLARKVGPGGFEKKVVIKRILSQYAADAPRIEMFLSEARIAARLNHPNIVQIYDLGEIEGEYFIAMEYVKGWDLAKIGNRLRDKNMAWPVDIACWVASELCGALRAAQDHKNENGVHQPIVHRDVSPENVFVSVDGAVKLGDFGVAKIADNPSYTQPGSLKGKLGYVAPERLTDDKRPLDGRVDIYSAGVVLHECLSGTKLFLRNDSARTLFAIMEHKVPRLSDLRSDVPEALDDVIAHALSKDPEKRYATAAKMRDDLDRFLARSARPVTPSVVASWLDVLFEGVTAGPIGDISLSDLGVPRTAATEIRASDFDFDKEAALRDKDLD